ncbi:mannosyltransferase [Aquimarina agarilytica]|uniref:mannosyltransferase n=1 Tax=Aquimarina agarilytica TaxID=1087449 RepID=UPI000289BBE2|nr:mannosyltransferase [Aquimarina agarilytica]
MASKKIQIIAFNNPYPVNYGGVIDVFYKIEALKEIGYQVYLHIFYDDRVNISVLEKLCEEVYLYKRNKLFYNFFSLIPFSVKSRNSKELYARITNKTNIPVLFESIQTTYILKKFHFNNETLVRTHNIEHEYYFGIAKSESCFFKKLIFYIEGWKLKRYQSVLKKADIILTLSERDTSYFNSIFKGKTLFLPVFHGNKKVKETMNSKSKFALYHGDLSISDNVESAIFICSLFYNLKQELVIASSVLPNRIKKIIKNYSNIKYINIREEEVLEDLLAKAHVNILVSLQESGTKLKVFNALYKGKYCIVNANIVDDKNILKLCYVANTKSEFQKSIQEIFGKDYQFSSERARVLKNYESLNLVKKLSYYLETNKIT